MPPKKGVKGGKGKTDEPAAVIPSTSSGSGATRRSADAAGLEQSLSPIKKCTFWEQIADGDDMDAMDIEQSIANLKIGESRDMLKLRIVMVGPIAKSSNGITYFKVVGQDQSGRVDIVSFGDEALKLGAVIKMNDCIRIKECLVRASSLDPGKKEITLKNAQMVSVYENDVSLPDIEVDLKSILKVTCESFGAVVDLLGIVVQVDSLKSGVSANGKPFKLRNVHVTDCSTKSCIAVTFWGPQAEFYEFKLYHPLILLKGTVNVFQDTRSITAGFESAIWMDPNSVESRSLLTWFHSECKKNQIQL